MQHNNKPSATAMESAAANPLVEPTQRRQFLKGLVGASAVAGLAAVSATAVAQPIQQPDAASATAKKGDLNSAHIRAYYASCR